MIGSNIPISFPQDQGGYAPRPWPPTGAGGSSHGEEAARREAEGEAGHHPVGELITQCVCVAYVCLECEPVRGGLPDVFLPYAWSRLLNDQPTTTKQHPGDDEEEEGIGSSGSDFHTDCQTVHPTEPHHKRARFELHK